MILGIDPGLTITGYAVVDSKNRLIEKGFWQLRKYSSHQDRIHVFYTKIHTLLKNLPIKAISYETPYVGKNMQSALKLGYLRGVIKLIASQQNLPLYEYSPSEIKQAITGSGRATKEQIARLLKQLYPGLEITKEDESDAIAVALCGLWRK